MLVRFYKKKEQQKTVISGFSLKTRRKGRELRSVRRVGEHHSPHTDCAPVCTGGRLHWRICS